ncbi:hypothetical protein [Cetobacterium sp. SF1]|uniref:hypothetical protein n=1 Tax=Cetobacterium sp. SF1 TaxID=3417654 RepID=UPI003CF11E1A
MDFRSNELFMKAIKSNNVLGIKSCLEGFIKKYQGNKMKCDEAIDFAIRNSSFNWEEDDKRYLGKPRETIEDQYYYETERLVQNFTKERYLKVLDLYRKYKGIDEKITSESPKVDRTENRTTSFNSKKNFKGQKLDQEERTIRLRIGILVAVVIIILGLLLKMVF